MENAATITPEWLQEARRARRIFTLEQFRVFLDGCERIIREEYGSESIEIRDRQVDTSVTTIRKKIRKS